MVSEVIFALVLAGKREFLVLARREERSVCCQHCKERREVLYVVYIGKWVAQREREGERESRGWWAKLTSLPRAYVSNAMAEEGGERAGEAPASLTDSGVFFCFLD